MYSFPTYKSTINFKNESHEQPSQNIKDRGSYLLVILY